MGALVTNTYERFPDHGDTVTRNSGSDVTEIISQNPAEHIQRLPNGNFAPGNSANPNGRPRSAKLVSDALKEALASDNLATTLKERLVGLTENADKDSVRLAAISEIVDRTEGKAVQNIRHAGVFLVAAPGAEALAALDSWASDDE